MTAIEDCDAMTNLASLLVTLVSIVASALILASSRQPSILKALQQPPFVASALWLATYVATIAAYPLVGTVLGDVVLTAASWVLDFAARIVLLWFTLRRLQAVWRGAERGLRIATWAVQVAHVGALAAVLATLVPAPPTDPETGQPLPLYRAMGSAYVATGVLVTSLDAVFIVRLHRLRRRAHAIHIEGIRLDAFVRAGAAMAACVGLEVAMLVVIATGIDPLWAYYGIAFAFRCVFSEVISEAVREAVTDENAGGDSAAAKGDLWSQASAQEHLAKSGVLPPGFGDDEPSSEDPESDANT
nr:hypothetical protein HK105_006207 [Polyrhizophydium stewartii]